MRLARKLILAVVIGVLLVVVAHDYFAIRDDIREYESRISNDVATMGYGLSITLEQLVRDSGAEAADRMIARRNEDDRIRVRWVALDVPPADRRAVELPAPLIADLRQGKPVQLIRGSGESARLFVYRPFFNQRPVHDLAEASESLAPIRAKERRQIVSGIRDSIVILLLAAGATLVLGFRFVARPVQELVGQARRIGAGDLSHRLKLTGHNEISELAEELNAMCDRLGEARDRLAAESAARLNALEQVRHADRLATVGQLASGVAHELGTPLNVVAGYAKMIGAGSSPDEDRESARVIAEQAARMTAIIRQLLDFARRSKPRLASGDLTSVTGHTIELLSPLASQQRVELRLLPSRPSGRVRMDEAQLQQAITNLILNAVQAMPGGGLITVELADVRAASPGTDSVERACVRLTIEDQGTGIEPAHLQRIFEPFFTTKDVGSGTGLGLSVCYGIVEEHGGFIAVDSKVGVGSRFSIFLPAIDGHEGQGLHEQ